jgi:hypothetical protein
LLWFSFFPLCLKLKSVVRAERQLHKNIDCSFTVFTESIAKSQ